ncbi:hypothetical protein FB451DRAFT_1556491 [Mycena latifolia]|nr:hypothetical protein FB451DRAFT_1556491 [Mycena latifolia]
MLTYFIPLAALSIGALLSDASPIFSIGNAVASATVTATVVRVRSRSIIFSDFLAWHGSHRNVWVTETADWHAFSRISSTPSSRAASASPPVLLIQPFPALPPNISPIVGLPSSLSIPPELVKIVASSGLSVATRLSNLSIATNVISSALSVAISLVTPIFVPGGSRPSNCCQLDLQRTVSAANFVSTVLSDTTNALAMPTGAAPSSAGTLLPSNVISSVLSTATGTSSGDRYPHPSEPNHQLCGQCVQCDPRVLTLVNGPLVTNLAGSISQLRNISSFDLFTFWPPTIPVELRSLEPRIAAQRVNDKIQSLNAVLNGLSGSTTSTTDTTQLLSQGTAIAQRVVALTPQMNTLVAGCHRSTTPVSLTQLCSALQIMQSRLQTMYSGLVPHCGSSAQGQVLSDFWTTTSSGLNMCILKI